MGIAARKVPLWRIPCKPRAKRAFRGKIIGRLIQVGVTREDACGLADIFCVQSIQHAEDVGKTRHSEAGPPRFCTVTRLRTRGYTCVQITEHVGRPVSHGRNAQVLRCRFRRRLIAMSAPPSVSNVIVVGSGTHSVAKWISSARMKLPAGTCTMSVTCSHGGLG